MKKLFAVRDNSTNKLMPDFFDKKMEAKKVRDELNVEAHSDTRYTVTLGPDHHRF